MLQHHEEPVLKEDPVLVEDVLIYAAQCKAVIRKANDNLDAIKRAMGQAIIKE